MHRLQGKKKESMLRLKTVDGAGADDGCSSPSWRFTSIYEGAVESPSKVEVQQCKDITVHGYMS